MKTYPSDFKVGDIVWYVPQGYALAIRCRITEIDDWARNKHPSGYLFYWIDEPVGHGLCDDELFSTEEKAAEFLKSEHAQKPSITLSEFREQVVKFIVSTHGLSESETIEAERRLLQSYPLKGTTEWFMNHLGGPV